MTKDNSKEEKMQKVLYSAFLACKTEEDVAALLEDMCTYREVEQMTQRVCAAQMLKAGATYAEIIEETDISSATLSRVSRCVQRGSGGYARFVPDPEEK